MARRRRFRKPLLPGLWTVAAVLLLMGCIGGLFWVLGSSTQLTRVETPATKGK
ncbi:MAG: hypothetical protein R3F13_18635 [Prosthecobacter sp.]